MRTRSPTHVNVGWYLLYLCISFRVSNGGLDFWQTHIHMYAVNLCQYVCVKTNSVSMYVCVYCKIRVALSHPGSRWQNQHLFLWKLPMTRPNSTEETMQQSGFIHWVIQPHQGTADDKQFLEPGVFAEPMGCTLMVGYLVALSAMDILSERSRG